MYGLFYYTSVGSPKLKSTYSCQTNEVYILSGANINFIMPDSIPIYSVAGLRGQSYQ